MFDAIRLNNLLYSKLIDEAARMYANFSSRDWDWCLKTNGTYLDCPIANNQNKTMVVGVHNPAV
jgi:hypothetical protein